MAFSLFSSIFWPSTFSLQCSSHYSVWRKSIHSLILVRDCARDKIQVHICLTPKQILTTIHGLLVKFLYSGFFHTPSNICINTGSNEILKLKTPSCTKLSSNLENSWWLCTYSPQSNFQPLLTKNRYTIGQKGCHIITTSGSSIQKVFLNI